MDSLKHYFEVQRRDNQILKEDIVATLESLISPLTIPPSSSNRSPTKYCNYITELCHFEQKINHKLTEINFELKKFILQNNRPEVGPPPLKQEELEDPLDDIATLKANSSRLISKLDKWREIESQKKEISCLVKNDLSNDAKLCSDSLQEQSFKDERPLICLDSTLTAEEKENVKTESKSVEHADNRGSTSKEKNKIIESLSCDHLELYKKQQIDSVSPSTTKEVGQPNVVESEISETEDQNLMEKIKNFELSLSNDKVPGDKNVHPTFNQKDSISEVMLKNLMELGNPKSKTVQQYPNIEINDELFGLSRINTVKSPEIKNEQVTAESTEKLPDTDISSYYDSETDVSSSVSERYLENNVNRCDSSKENSLKEYNINVDRTKCDIQQFERDDVQNTNKIVGVLETDSYDIQGAKREDIGTKNEVSLNPSVPQKIKTEPESPKPVFSAEEKIKKLGLEDRRTLFEKTKKMAVLPDLRLRPSGSSVTDTEKLQHMRNRRNKFEIPESASPTVNSCCLFSHVESPSEFYIHLDTEESKLIDNLNDLITEEYKQTKSVYVSKDEASQDIERYCCAYVKSYKMFYRAEIVDWLLQDSKKLVLVKLVDYGNIVHVHFKHLRMISEQFCSLPQLAIKCYLPFLYPPGSTKNEPLAEWPSSSTEAFSELAGLSVENSKVFFRIVYVEKDGTWTGVDLHQLKSKDPNTIGQLLIDLGHAVEIVSRKDDPLGILSDEEDIKDLELCDNINEVILGYDPKDEARICKFTKPDGGKCFKKNCKLEHAKFNRGGFTTDQTLTYAEALSDLNLPKANEYTAIRFTTFISASCFYVNLVLYVQNLRDLEYTMNNPANCSKFERYKILPAHGEIVLVKHWQKRWMRGKVRHHLFKEDGKCTGVQVFMVDYGDVIDVSLDNIRHIKAEYLNLPFQAVECVFTNYEGSGKYSLKDMDRFFYENMVFRSFSAKVLAVSDMHMGVEVYFKNKYLGDILVDYGFLKRVKNNKNIFPHPNSVIIPG